MDILKDLHSLDNNAFGEMLDKLDGIKEGTINLKDVIPDAQTAVQDVIAPNKTMTSHIALIELIIAMNALYRPGPLDYIPTYIKNRRIALIDPAKIEYDCPAVKPILETTFGVIVYQEQVMDICRTLAGYTWGRADLVRRAMSKKHQEEIDAERKIFVYGGEYTDNNGNTIIVPGCIKNKIGTTDADSERIANIIYDKMVAFAKYAFNKSHATAYALTSFYTAWLKYYYPAEYLTAVMNWAPDTDRLAVCIADARDFGNEVLPPSINESDFAFKVLRSKTKTQKGQILFGLSNIKGVNTAAEDIMLARKEKPFENFQDFLLRSGANSKAVQNLVVAGAFDSMGYERAQLDQSNNNVKQAIAIIKKIKEKEKLILNIETLLTFVDQYNDIEDLKERIEEEGFIYKLPKTYPTSASLQKKINTAQSSLDALKEELFSIDFKTECYGSKIEELKAEKEVLGVYLTGHPIDGCDITTVCINECTTEDKSLSGVIENFELRKSKKGSNFATFDLSDKTGNIKVTIFSNAYERYKDLLFEGSLVKITGNIQVDDFKKDSDNEDTEENLKMIGNDVTALKIKTPDITVVFNDVEEWNNEVTNIKSETAFNDMFDIENGSSLAWISKLTGQYHKTNIRINPEFPKFVGWQVV